MRRRWILIGCFLLMLSILIRGTNTLQPLLLCLSYLFLTFANTAFGYGLFHDRIHQSNKGLYMIGVCILIAQSILLIDTFMFHSIYWIPGIIRYPVISLYGPAYMLFVLPGICLCFKET